ncbi:MAG: hypothetical protein GY937_22795, partial [bacterium]|nr:hypothetical protein [bacterium]
AERSALIQDVIREMGERLATPVGERQVTPKGLPVIEPYEVAITYRGDCERQNRTASVMIRFGKEVSGFLLGFRKLQIQWGEGGAVRLRGLTHTEQDPSNAPRHAVPQKIRGRMVTIEGYRKWVALVRAHGWASGETRIYYPTRAGEFIALTDIQAFQERAGESPDPQMTIHV